MGKDGERLASYRSAVSEVKRLLRESEDDMWRVAELTYQMVDEQGVKAADWAADTGLSTTRVNSYRKVWKRFASKKDRFDGRTFNDHCELAAQSETVARELLAEAVRTGQSVGIVRKTRSKEAVFRARMEAAAQASEGLEVHEDLIEAASNDPDIQKEARKLARKRLNDETMADRQRGAGREAFSGITKAVSNLGTMNGETLVADAEKLLDRIAKAVEDDADMPVRVVRKLAKLVNDMSIEIEVYAARRGQDLKVGR